MLLIGGVGSLGCVGCVVVIRVLVPSQFCGVANVATIHGKV